MDRNHFKGVVWPRPPTDKNPHHRYVVIGMLITEKPIPELEGVNEAVLDGFFPGIEDALGVIPKREPNLPTGDASNVMCSLDII